MLNYENFYQLLEDNKLITPIWKEVLKLIDRTLLGFINKGEVLGILAIYFSLVDDGNITMSLDKDVLHNKWFSKLDSNKVLLMENEEYDESGYNLIYTLSEELMNYLYLFDKKYIPQLLGDESLFVIEDNYLYSSKLYKARIGVVESIIRLFSPYFQGESTFDYNKETKDYFALSKGQEKAVVNGINRNLIITGGPGTGKTTSILFLLLNLLSKNDKYTVYLTAPSGKASSRMKESIIGGFANINDDYIAAHQDLIKRISNFEESTIHRLLGVNQKSGGFNYNIDHQFNEYSIFVIDEASMIDVTIFNALLSAIPTGARVFIMGDKNQLPSVDVGAVFGDLLKRSILSDNNIVELDESRRFSSDTIIYQLAEEINNGLPLSINKDEWKEYDSFHIEEVDKKKCPVYFYNINSETAKEKEVVEHVVNIWNETFFKDLKNKSTDLDFDYDSLKSLFKYQEQSKILCAENKGPRGVTTINQYIESLNGTNKNEIYHPGQVMMINTNNKRLDLYNGDSGIVVSFKNDSTLYLMVNKSSLIISNDGYNKDNIFKIKDFVFYPIRMIKKVEIDLAFAISIHKSQGSDYPSILVLLPTKKGHPLLNRQILYTAITRTKGNTYILSNQLMLEEARDIVLVRDTNID